MGPKLRGSCPKFGVNHCGRRSSKCQCPEMGRNLKCWWNPSTLSVTGAEWKGKKGRRWVCQGGRALRYGLGVRCLDFSLNKEKSLRVLRGARTQSGLCYRKITLAALGRMDWGSWSRSRETTVWIDWCELPSHHLRVQGMVQRKGSHQRQLLN